MDLRPLATPPTDAERAAVDAVLGPPAPDANPAIGALRVARGQRHLLLPGLHAIQERCGWVSAGALGYLCQRLHVPPAEAYGVASFYALFALAERPATALHVCDDVACHAAGVVSITDALAQRVGPAGAARAGATWLPSPCLGLCEHAPAAMLTVAGAAPRAGAWGPLTADAAVDAIATGRAPAPPATVLHQRTAAPGRYPERLLAQVGRVDPTDLDAYRAAGGYQALRRALDRGPAWVLREVTDSGLVGRGGAAFPTGRKWTAVAQALGPTRYLVCNADESEPGTFKDRILMEEDPFALVEAMTIAAVTVGATRGFIYLRGEYPLARARLAGAIAAAQARGLVGADVLGSGKAFELELRLGAGAYICGEETALFASLEGYRGEPRTKPPFPVEAGLFGKPTVVNNVETLVNVLGIITDGAAAYRAVGTAGSPGTRLFCVSGRVARPGLYELPFGVPLAELLALAGAPTEVAAVLLGGAAGTFLGPAQLALPLSFEATRAVGASLGSGVVLVLDRAVPIAPVLARIARFFRDESCGQCVPCRVGTVRQEELITRLGRGAPHGSVATERALLAELGQAMRDASICGLGQTAASAIESAVANLGVFPDPEAR
ncbi:MAG: NAD(P)H-dependent oxidoreductase subunit E [Kofleriaceae bacterium]